MFYIQNTQLVTENTSITPAFANRNWLQIKQQLNLKSQKILQCPCLSLFQSLEVTYFFYSCFNSGFEYQNLKVLEVLSKLLFAPSFKKSAVISKHKNKFSPTIFLRSSLVCLTMLNQLPKLHMQSEFCANQIYPHNKMNNKLDYSSIWLNFVSMTCTEMDSCKLSVYRKYILYGFKIF